MNGVVEDRLTRALRSLDHKSETWFWVEGSKKPYICETHDEYMHFCARLRECGCRARVEVLPKV